MKYYIRYSPGFKGFSIHTNKYEIYVSKDGTTIIGFNDIKNHFFQEELCLKQFTTKNITKDGKFFKIKKPEMNYINSQIERILNMEIFK